MTNGKFFSTTKKGEIHELKQELRTLDRKQRKGAVKKVIAAMTVGKDVSSLFPDVVNCMQTEDLELKKLVYLYLINYAKTQPDLAIMGVNTFVKDSQDHNPLIRSLAVRTMGCIRVDKITEYLCDPLQRCLKDEDPYVRKTAAVCVAKLYDINAELVVDRGFLTTLLELLGDANPMVVANALAALSEIKAQGAHDALKFTSVLLFKLLRALNECTEWGQVFILDALSDYVSEDPKEAEAIIERVLPRLQHANSAVVLSAIKVIFQQLEPAGRDPTDKALLRKITPSLVTLLAAEPEVQYVALRNISLLVQKHPSLLTHDVKVFFCKYNDPSYVKLEKLEVMVSLTTAANIDQVLMEFREYAAEVDIDFVRKAVRAIGRCAIALEAAAEQCMAVLIELVKGGVSHVVQEAVIVMKDVFRRYPDKYEGAIAVMCSSMSLLDEAEAKASMVWVLGEYAHRIENAADLLEGLLDTFPEEPAEVQMQLVSAAVKMFLKDPTGKPQSMIQLVLTYATQATDNPDLRDKAFVYWRLLSTDQEAARAIVLGKKATIATSGGGSDPALVSELLSQLGMLASVYHLPPSSFTSSARPAVQQVDDTRAPTMTSDDGGPSQSASGAADGIDLLDLGSDDDESSPPQQQLRQQQQAHTDDTGLDDILGDLNQPSPTSADDAPSTQYDMLFSSEKGSGCQMEGVWVAAPTGPSLRLRATNNSPEPLTGWMIQFNKNAHGLSPATQSVAFGSIPAGTTADADVVTAVSEAMKSTSSKPRVIQVAMKNDSHGAVYFTSTIPEHVSIV